MYKFVLSGVFLFLISGDAFAECEPAIKIEKRITPIACKYIETEKMLEADKHGKLKETGVEHDYFGALVIIKAPEKISEFCKSSPTKCTMPVTKFLYKSDDKNICDKFKHRIAIKISYVEQCCDEMSNRCPNIDYIITEIRQINYTLLPNPHTPLP